MENKRILADTSVLIDFFRKKNKKNTLLYSLQQDYDIYISAITEFEFLAGVKEDNFRSIKHFFEDIGILFFDSKAAIIASSIYRELKSTNRLIEFRDIFIGATAISRELPLATLNQEHFRRIKELRVLP